MTLLKFILMECLCFSVTDLGNGVHKDFETDNDLLSGIDTFVAQNLIKLWSNLALSVGLESLFIGIL
jgi:hypothetical protein